MVAHKGGTMKKLLLLAAFSLIAAAAFSQGMPRDSVVLGERTVDFHGDHDVIAVGDYEGWFKDIGFWVERNNIEIFNLEVKYGDGQKQRFETRMIFDAGTRSRLIHLEGERRRIRSISFSFRTVGSWLEGRARVVVFGVK
jgi:hypothetical protein